MKQHAVPFGKTNAFSRFFLDYIGQKPELTPFYNRFPKPEFFGDQIKEKAVHFKPEQRRLLHDRLRAQYGSLNVSEATDANITSLLSEKTFTVTTGHQLNLFTGPLYFIYKIATVINACRQLSMIHPEFRFVPVYWMASEDHDFEEIRSFRLNGKIYSWNSTQKGAVGRFSLKDLQPLLKEIPGDLSPFLEAYSKSATLAEAVRKYVNALFGHHGLVVLDGDDAQLKSSFCEVMEADVFTGITHQLVTGTNAKLGQLGYDPQVFAREINFFWLGEGVRERLEKSGDRWKVLQTELSFSETELRELIRNHPEQLSPNVILRPLYQETIMPNLAYVGGPAENVYWLQLKDVFSHFGVPFPMLMPRNFLMVMEAPLSRLFQKTGLSLEELFIAKHDLLNLVTRRFSEHELSLSSQRKALEETYRQVRSAAVAIDTTLGQMTDAASHRVMKGLETIEKKMLRAERRRQSDRLGQVERLKDALFPGGGLQERTDNLLLFSQTDPQFISRVLEALDPFGYSFTVLEV